MLEVKAERCAGIDVGKKFLAVLKKAGHRVSFCFATDDVTLPSY
jgi:hypothetical protein